MLAGPTVIAGEAHGLSSRQVQLVGWEGCFVGESVRAGVTSLWPHVWATIGARAGG